MPRNWLAERDVCTGRTGCMGGGFALMLLMLEKYRRKLLAENFPAWAAMHYRRIWLTDEILEVGPRL
jgi:hypothetical protein